MNSIIISYGYEIFVFHFTCRHTGPNPIFPIFKIQGKILKKGLSFSLDMFVVLYNNSLHIVMTFL